VLPATMRLAGRGLPRWLALIVVMLALIVSMTVLTLTIVGSFVSNLGQTRQQRRRRSRQLGPALSSARPVRCSAAHRCSRS
jgi:predicted PurR-regulated permease PerM